MTLKIALDVDSVLADVIIPWNKNYKKLYGKILTKSDINTWDFWKKLELNNKQFNEIFTITWNQWRDIPPTEQNLCDKVNKLNEFGVVDIVTGRSIETISNVKKWLEWQKIIYNKFIRVPSQSLKGNLPYDIFIDDSPHNVINALEHNKYSILYNQPWNQQVKLDKKIFRVNNLHEAIKIIKILKH